MFLAAAMVVSVPAGHGGVSVAVPNNLQAAPKSMVLSDATGNARSAGAARAPPRRVPRAFGTGKGSRMAIVGVTSWMSSNFDATKESHATRFGRNAAYPAADCGGYGAGNVGFLLNTLCTSKPKGSPSTYAQLGYGS